MEHAITSWTIRLALLCYALAIWLELRAKHRANHSALARLVWTIGLVFYLSHVASAFHFYHGWSHCHAYEHTAQETAEIYGIRWGAGIYFNHLLTALWIADAGWWWLRPNSYANRAKWITIALHGYFVFMIFNATVVAEAGVIRWAGLAGFLVLGLAALQAFARRRAQAENGHSIR